jgi:mono/diheme cytochrome c family protein
MKIAVFASLTVLTLATLACSLGTGRGAESMTVDELQAEFDKLPAGDATRGEQSFRAQPCQTCHADLPIGPAFPDDPPLGTRAGTRRSGYPAEVYLYESIVQPNTYIVPGFKKDIMPAEYGETLTDQELADLVAYLLRMK